MRKVTQEQVQHYQENGFVVLPDLLDAAELATWQRVILHAIEGRSTRLPLDGENYEESFRSEGFTESDEYYNKVFMQKINLWKTDSDACRMVHDDRLGQSRKYAPQYRLREPPARPGDRGR